ncbi:TIGR02099 family protein [Noviherbaspirillum cavernae]|uniref:TIGR02099 family protein n=1 Tax=Noviherbaspirillum cavernae TaxID=2320862 RepID=A0A418WZA7_9BURK|nr:YhdP family protein [Noviherbaspirillum cavernae]RJG05569.1 TIGR02099 family protein [Noviherbaspirillum cavernae]
MSNDQPISNQTIGRAAACWKVIQQQYRAFNAVTHHALGFLLKSLVVVYFVFCALFLGLRYVVLPNIDNYKADVENMATHVIGNKVSIAGINASWDGLRPQLALDNVAIHDKSGNETLRLPKVSVTVSWLSVLVGDLRLHRLEVRQPEMDVRRDAAGNLYVAGIFIDMHKSGGDSTAADWVLSQHEIAIRGGTLRWKDDKRGAPEVVLNGVDLVLRNQWRHHEFALKATPPAGFSAPLDVRAAFVHPRFSRSISDPMRWKGELYADLENADLTAWKPYVDYPIELGQGRGSVRAWLDFDHAKVANFTADLSLANVSARLRKDLAPLNLAQVDGRVSVKEDFNPDSEDGTPTFGMNGHAIALTDFSLRTDDGLVLPPTTISESFTPERKGKPEKTAIIARRLDLKTLAEFGERLPISAEQRQMLTDFAPQGVLQDFSVQWQGKYPQISSYSAKGRFEGLSLAPQAPRPARPRSGKTAAQAAVPGIPGFENLTGEVDANDKGGSIRLVSDKIQLQFPGYFAEPSMPFDRLNMQANWAFQDNDQLLLDVRNLEFEQGTLSGSLSGRHLMPLNSQQAKTPGVIDMTGKVTGLDVTRVGSFLPLNTPASLREWLTGALVGGAAEDVRIKVKGDLADFPFHARVAGEKPKGEFSVFGRIKDGKLNYTPGHFAKDGKAPFWPLLEDINGTIAFDRSRMEIRGDSAKTHGAALSNVIAVIDDLAVPEGLLEISGDAAGSLQDFVGYANDSPVAEWIGHFTEETKASGNAKLALKLELPLAHMDEARVKGTLQFINNNVTLFNAMPSLAGTSGKLEFHEKGFNLNGIKASFVGGPVALTGGMQRDSGVLVKAEGTVTSDGLRKAYPTSAMQRLSERIAGSARYSTAIRVRNHQPEVVVESNLAGLALDFPAPLRKGAHETMPLKFELTGVSSNEASFLRDEMKLALGSAIAVRYERQKSTEKGAEWRVVRGGIGVNVPAPQPDNGLIANVNLKTLNIDEWGRAVEAIVGEGLPAEQDRQADVLGIGQYIEPEVLAARATELIVMGKKLDNVVVGASHQKGVWQANIDSEQASGYLTWNQSRSGRGLGRVTARLASLVIPKSAASDVSELLEGKNEATQMPGLDIVAENFELFGKKFGHIELAADNARGSAGREWRISKLLISNPDGELKASGKWAKQDNHSVSNLSYTLYVADAGKLLERFGFANVLRGGKGKMEGEISWKGQPFALDVPSLSGNFHMDIASGQFLKVDPSAAKLLGVLNMQALPRRLALDFRDVFSEGFAFDGITAAASITNGVAKTDSFKMRGVAATVLIDGTADIGRESQNLHVAVIPEINVGAASVVYGLAVNPVIGVGTFLAQLFLRDPLMKAFTFEYQVTGPWKEPVVTKLARKMGSPAADPVTESAKPG